MEIRCHAPLPSRASLSIDAGLCQHHVKSGHIHLNPKPICTPTLVFHLPATHLLWHDAAPWTSSLLTPSILPQQSGVLPQQSGSQLLTRSQKTSVFTTLQTPSQPPTQPPLLRHDAAPRISSLRTPSSNPAPTVRIILLYRPHAVSFPSFFLFSLADGGEGPTGLQTPWALRRHKGEASLVTAPFLP